MNAIVGIDVSKEFLDCHSLADNASWRIPYQDSELEALSAKLAGARLVVVEATGGYQRRLVHHLHFHKIPVAVVNPRRVRDFAKASGILAKTDQVDARILAQFAATFAIEPQHAPNEPIEAVKALVGQREDLVKCLVALKNRRKQTTQQVVLDSIDRMLLTLKEEIQQINRALAAHLKCEPQLQEKARLLYLVKGVGPVLTTTLLGMLPELGRIDSKAIAALAGLAPFNRDSGKYRGSRHIWGGRSQVRKSLYLAANIARRCDAEFMAFYEKLRAAGKPFKVAIIACARKLLVKLNAKMRDHLASLPA